ncbi:hypothetical protein LJK87_17380 [Paenibacillus sp. P25]|nr:hypothetical protein LJK87_17380 [Paenibacillus sp. P25]
MDNFKDIEISGRKFRIKKFGARDGCFMALKVSGILAGIFNKPGKPGKAKKVDDGGNLLAVVSEIGKLSEEDFTWIQDKCLSVCYEVLPAGLTPVLREDGNFGVIGLEEDTVTVMMLTAHALMHNLSFLKEGNLKGLVTSLSTGSQ